MAHTEEGAEGESTVVRARRRSLSARLASLLFLLLFLGGLGYGAYYMGLLEQFGLGKPAVEIVAAVETPVDLPPMFVTMLDRQGRKFQLGVKVRIVLASSLDAERAQSKLPVILDLMNTYLRELRLEDLRDRRVGLSRLRQEMLLQMNVVLTPIEVKDLLFQDINVAQG